MGAEAAIFPHLLLPKRLSSVLINWVLASLAVGFVAIINGVIKENLTFQIRILDMGIRQCALLFIVSLFVAAVASFLPVMRIARKKPIDAIQNR